MTMVKQSAFSSHLQASDATRSESINQASKRQHFWKMGQWLFEEFGFAILLLIFSFGSLAVATALTNFQAAREWAQVSLRELYAMENTCQVPSVPTNIRARSGWDSGGEIVVSWLPADRADHYSVAFGKQAGVYEFGSTDVGKERQFVVKELQPGTNYYFVVNAVNECGESGYSSEVKAQASSLPTPTNVMGLSPSPTLTQGQNLSIVVEKIEQEASGSGSLVGKKGEEIVLPVISPYYGDLPQDMQQANLSEDELLTPQEQRIELANLATNILAKRGFRLLLTGLLLFTLASVLALMGMKHLKKGRRTKERKEKVAIHKGKLTDLEEHDIETPANGGGIPMGFGN